MMDTHAIQDAADEAPLLPRRIEASPAEEKQVPKALQEDAAELAVVPKLVAQAKEAPGPFQVAAQLAAAAAKEKSKVSKEKKPKTKGKAKAKAKAKATPKAKTVKQLAAGKATANKAGAKDIPVPTLNQRLKLRPNGCGKCRYKPGCTPSCIKAKTNPA